MEGEGEGEMKNLEYLRSPGWWLAMRLEVGDVTMTAELQKFEVNTHQINIQTCFQMGSAATQVYQEQGVAFFLSLWGPAEEFQNVRRSFPGTFLQEATQLATTEHLC